MGCHSRGEDGSLVALGHMTNTTDMASPNDALDELAFHLLGCGAVQPDGQRHDPLSGRRPICPGCSADPDDRSVAYPGCSWRSEASPLPTGFEGRGRDRWTGYGRDLREHLLRSHRRASDLGWRRGRIGRRRGRETAAGCVTACAGGARYVRVPTMVERAGSGTEGESQRDDPSDRGRRSDAWTPTRRCHPRIACAQAEGGACRSRDAGVVRVRLQPEPCHAGRR